MLAAAIAATSGSVGPGRGSYRIGDRGPGGGWIFYDRGKASDGWRYLEAAAEDQEDAPWGCAGRSIQGARQNFLGAGRANTYAIMRDCPEMNTAARKAASHRGGGREDWYLPSKSEMTLMHENLRRSEKAGFGHPDYWTSSEIDAHSAWDLSPDDANHASKHAVKKVRAVRMF